MFGKLLSLLLCVLVSLPHYSNAQVNCITCDTILNNDCISNLTAFTSQTCSTGICYTQIDQNIIIRGCIGTPETVTATSCTAASNCYQCSTDNCNSEQTICQTCDSSTDAACAQLTSSNTNYNTICTVANAQCYVGLNGMNTVRRCATTEDTTCAPTNTEPNAICQLCSGGNCNSNLYPSNRLTCYQCAANATETACNNPTAQETSVSAHACPNYIAADKCYTYATSATSMQRGCVSDAGDNVCTATSTNTACATCNSNACNSRQFTYQPSLQCIQCNSKDQAMCAAQQETSLATNCNPISYNLTEQCYTQLSGSITYRGCLSAHSTDLGECTNANGCVTCSGGNGCNNGIIINCKQCNTDNDNKCTTDAASVASVACSASKCYETWAGSVYERGCLANANATVNERCSAQSATACVTCNTNDCNTANVADLKTIYVSLLMGTVILTLKNVL